MNFTKHPIRPILKNYCRGMFFSKVITLFVLFQTSLTLMASDSEYESSYQPGNKEQFVMINFDTLGEQKHYRSLCKKDDMIGCINPMPYEKYKEMRGYFESSEPYKTNKVGNFTYQYFNVVMENGDKLIFITNDEFGKYGTAAEMMPLDEYQSIQSFIPEPLFPGSDIQIVKKENVYGIRTLELSNGQNVRQEMYELIKSFVSKVGGDHQMIELLVGNHIDYDHMDDVYKIKRIGSDLEKNIGLRISVANGVPSLWVRAMYYGDDWLFADSFKLAADDYRYQSPDYEFSRDNSSGDVWEWITFNAGPEQIEYMKALSEAQLSTIRFQGNQYYSDLTLDDDDKKHINDFLNLFDLMK